MGCLHPLTTPWGQLGQTPLVAVTVGSDSIERGGNRTGARGSRPPASFNRVCPPLELTTTTNAEGWGYPLCRTTS